MTSDSIIFNNIMEKASFRNGRSTTIANNTKFKYVTG
jgi:hypothetical protein